MMFEAAGDLGRWAFAFYVEHLGLSPAFAVSQAAQASLAEARALADYLDRAS